MRIMQTWSWTVALAGKQEELTEHDCVALPDGVSVKSVLNPGVRSSLQKYAGTVEHEAPLEVEPDTVTVKLEPPQVPDTVAPARLAGSFDCNTIMAASNKAHSDEETGALNAWEHVRVAVVAVATATSATSAIRKVAILLRDTKTIRIPHPLNLCAQ